MISKLMTGIEQAIRKEFPETTYKIFTEATERVSPCFFILCVSQSRNAKLGDRFILNTSFEVQYFSGSGNNECWGVAEKLRELLDVISLEEDLVQGRNGNYRVDNGVLHFVMDYNIPMMRRQDAVDFMEEVTVYGKTRKAGK